MSGGVAGVALSPQTGIFGIFHAFDMFPNARFLRLPVRVVLMFLGARETFPAPRPFLTSRSLFYFIIRLAHIDATPPNTAGSRKQTKISPKITPGPPDLHNNRYKRDRKHPAEFMQ